MQPIYLDAIEMLVRPLIDGEHNPLHSCDSSVAYALAHVCQDLVDELRKTVK